MFVDGKILIFETGDKVTLKPIEELKQISNCKYELCKFNENANKTGKILWMSNWKDDKTPTYYVDFGGKFNSDYYTSDLFKEHNSNVYEKIPYEAVLKLIEAYEINDNDKIKVLKESLLNIAKGYSNGVEYIKGE